MTEYLVFDTKPAAESAIRQIDAKLMLPKPGKNAATGANAPGKTGTVTWAEPWQRATDGKWVVIRCPDADPNRPFVVEPYDLAWAPSPV